MIKRPFLLRTTPLILRQWLFYRFYSKNAHQRSNLFANAPLALAPHVGLRLLPTDVAHQPIAWTGIYEVAVSQHIAELGRNGGMLLDVGANYGYFACLWAGLRTENRVIAFEASPRNQASLRHNVECNRLGAQIIIENKAIGQAAGEMYFSSGPEEQTGWGSLTHNSNAADTNVAVIDLDTYCSEQQIESISVLKIDVEGADAWVIEGAQRLLQQQQIGTVFFEEEVNHMHKLGIHPDTSARLLRDAGYQVRQIAPAEYMAVCQ